MTDAILLNLSRDRALVLFELLSRFQDSDVIDIQDPAEERVLWDIQASLEKVLEEPLSSEYRTRLEQARASVRGG